MGKKKRKGNTTRRNSLTIERIRKDFKKNYFAYLLIIPVLAWYIIFCYGPMWGISIAFKNYKPLLGFDASKWVGLKYFEEFFTGPYFLRTVKNTLMLNIWGLALGFTFPILLALLLNEIRGKFFKKTVQTITYMPHFISLVVIAGMIHIFTQSGGILTQLVNFLTGTEHSSLLGYSKMFRPIYTFSGIWQNVGWDSIIYLSAMSSIDPGLYEAADIDGAGRLRKMWHITLPAIRSTIVIMLILRVGAILNTGYEQIFLMQNSMNRIVSDVFDTYIYTKGVVNGDYSLATAAGMFKSVVSMIMVMSANRLAKVFGESGFY